MKEKHILVLGGTGKTGRRVASRLEQQKIPFRIGSRNAPLPFDWHHPSTWRPVLESASSVYLAFAPDLAAPGTTHIIADFLEVAKDAGVAQMVLLSGRGEPEAQACENLVIQSGIPWTVLRCSWFFQNFSESFLLEGIREGAVYLPVGPVLEPFVDAEDIADAAVAALTMPDRHQGRIYEITGPALMRFEDAIARIGKKSGRKIPYHTIPLAVYVAALKKANLPDDMIQLVTYLFTEVLDGRNASLATGIQEALGRAPRSFEDYLERTAPTGIWDL